MKNLTTLKTGLPGLFFYAIAICISASCSNTKSDSANDTSQPEQKDEKNSSEFAFKAAAGGIYEVELGKLAEMKGSSESVKELGRMMVKDHSSANEELKSLASRKNITLPATMDDKKQKDYDMLAEKSGEEFDKKYADMMIDDHEEDIELFKKESEHGADADLKSWASGKLPVLEHHLQMAKSASEAVKMANK